MVSPLHFPVFAAIIIFMFSCRTGLPQYKKSLSKTQIPAYLQKGLDTPITGSIISQFTVHSSQFTVHSSQFTVHSSQFTVHSSQFTVHSSQFTARGSKRPHKRATLFHTHTYLSSYAFRGSTHSVLFFSSKLQPAVSALVSFVQQRYDSVLANTSSTRLCIER